MRCVYGVYGCRYLEKWIKFFRDVSASKFRRNRWRGLSLQRSDNRRSRLDTLSATFKLSTVLVSWSLVFAEILSNFVPPALVIQFQASQIPRTDTRTSNMKEEVC